MNKNLIYFFSCFALCAILACEKNLIEQNYQFTQTDPTLANLKVINAYQSNIPVGAPGVGATRFFLYQDSKKLNGNALPSPGSWPGSNTYASVSPGASTLRMILDRRVNNIYGAPVAGDTLLSKQINLSAGKFHSLFVVDSFPKQDIVLIEDNFKRPVDTGVYQVRLANLVVSPARPISVYSRRQKKFIAENLPYKSVSPFITFPVPSIADTLDLFDATNTTKPIVSLNSFVGSSQRTYTMYVQGRFNFRTQAINFYTND